jgi:hypothetical protein
MKEFKSTSKIEIFKLKPRKFIYGLFLKNYKVLTKYNL